LKDGLPVAGRKHRLTDSCIDKLQKHYGMLYAEMLFLVTSVLSKQNGTYRACKMTLWLCFITVVTSTTRNDTSFALQGKIHGVNTKELGLFKTKTTIWIQSF